MEVHKTDDSLKTIAKDMNQHYTPLQENGKPMSRLSLYREYLIGLFFRIITLIIILAVLIALGLGLRYTDGLPRSEDFSNLQFDWKINPGDDLYPFNTSFQYNVLLDGHTHTVYSDGKMNVRQLLDWHLANGYNAIIVT